MNVHMASQENAENRVLIENQGEVGEKLQLPSENGGAANIRRGRSLSDLDICESDYRTREQPFLKALPLRTQH